MAVVGLDIGRRGVKLYTGTQLITYPAVVGEWRNMNLKGVTRGFNVVYNGDRFFAGHLALEESEFARQMLTESKVHEDSKLLALIALHIAGSPRQTVVTGVPVTQHTDEVKTSLVDMLKGRHTLEVDGVSKTFLVENVLVSVEGGAAFWSNPMDGLVRIIDAGSKTINYVTLLDRKYVDRESGTLTFGFDTNKSTDIKHIASRIAGEVSKKWSSSDNVFTVGGKAKELAKNLYDYFPKAKPYPVKDILATGIMEGEKPMYANAIGYYNIGRTVL